MTIYNKFMGKTLSELAAWLDEYGEADESPWILWWDKKYCSKCPDIKCRRVDTGEEVPAAYCELHDNCKFFPGEAIPDNEKIIKLWLEQESD